MKSIGISIITQANTYLNGDIYERKNSLLLHKDGKMTTCLPCVNLFPKKMNVWFVSHQQLYLSQLCLSNVVSQVTS